MRKSAIAFFAALFVCSAAFASGKMLSVQVVQNNPGQSRIWATSEQFEQSLLDYYFATGRIVSNSPIFVFTGDERERSKSLRAALIENRDGGVDYLVRVELFFRSTNSSNAERPRLSDVERVAWKVYDVLSGAELFDGSVSGDSVSGRDDETGVEKLAFSVAERAETDMAR